MNQAKKLALVLPCYNEQEILLDTQTRLSTLLADLVSRGKIAEDSFICYVDDGSIDKTWEMICQYHQEMPRTRGIKLSNNCGHQNALMAGMMTVKEEADCVITLDADLQDDIQVIEQMVEAHAQGYSVVYGVRSDRKKDTFFKRFPAQFFYKLMLLMKVKALYNHADFRLMDRRVLQALAQFDEVNLYLRGVFPLIGFRSTQVYYSRMERIAGETKYPVRKLMTLAWNGITSFSTFPLRVIFGLGLFIFFLSIALTLWAFIPVFTGNAVHGWASTVIPMFVFAGVQMISLGLIGEYIGKIYLEVKKRPRYFVEDYLKNKKF